MLAGRTPGGTYLVHLPNGDRSGLRRRGESGSHEGEGKDLLQTTFSFPAVRSPNKEQQLLPPLTKAFVSVKCANFRELGGVPRGLAPHADGDRTTDRHRRTFTAGASAAALYLRSMALPCTLLQLSFGTLLYLGRGRSRCPGS